MPKLCRINIEQREKVFEDINNFAIRLKNKFNCMVYMFGSFATGEIHEGSDIDLIVVGDFEERFFERIGKIIEMTELPIEPLVYTKEEFEEMKKSNPFIKDILRNAKKLA
jgi:predicted nucleotidyltransferase